MADYAARHPVAFRGFERFEGQSGNPITIQAHADIEDGDIIAVWVATGNFSPSVADGWFQISRNILGTSGNSGVYYRTWHTGDDTSWTYSVSSTYTGGACGSGTFWEYACAYVLTVDLPIGGFYGWNTTGELGGFSLNSSPYGISEHSFYASAEYLTEFVPGVGGNSGFGSSGPFDARASVAITRKNGTQDLTETVTLSTNATGTVASHLTDVDETQFDSCVANGQNPALQRRQSFLSRTHVVNEAPDTGPNRATWTSTWADSGINDSVVTIVHDFYFNRLGGPQLVAWSVNGIANNAGPDVDEGSLVPYTFQVEHDRYNFDSVYAELLDTSDFTSLDLHDYGAVVGDVDISGDLQLPPGFEGDARVSMSAYVSEEGSQFQYQDFAVIDFPVSDSSAQLSLRSRRVDLQELPYSVSRKQLRRR